MREAGKRSPSLHEICSGIVTAHPYLKELAEKLLRRLQGARCSPRPDSELIEFSAVLIAIAAAYRQGLIDADARPELAREAKPIIWTAEKS